MKNLLSVQIGQATQSGQKPVNQDFIATANPSEPECRTKGIVAAISDGISTSDVSQLASETAVKSFISDYYSTSEAWSVKNSGLKVIKAINYWLYAQTKNSELRFNFNKGYVCTFSALIIKSRTAHLFHCGDSRIYRVSGGALEQLTTDHRRCIDESTSYLSRGLGIEPHLDIDYQAVALTSGDIFLLTTDGIYEFLTPETILTIITDSTISASDKATLLVEKALEAGSDDNLSVQVVEIEKLPEKGYCELTNASGKLPPPPPLNPREIVDGYEVLREIYISSRSHVFLVRDTESQKLLVLKSPSAESRHDGLHLESFLTEDWIARKLNNNHLLKSYRSSREQTYLYTLTEFVEGISLAQWMKDNPSPSIAEVRNIVEQVAKGLQAMHRQEMVHQDLRPENILIDVTDTVKIIDFGATKVAGLSESMLSLESIPGTAQYSAPEFFVGRPGTHRSDIFSLVVITYQMLTGKLPYGTHVSRTNSKKAQQNLKYIPSQVHNDSIPHWVDFALKQALKIEPEKRYAEVSEFIHDLKVPNPKSEQSLQLPMIERNPILFWQRISLILFVMLLASLVL